MTGFLDLSDGWLLDNVSMSSNRVIIGVTGNDIYMVGNRFLQMALEGCSFNADENERHTFSQVSVDKTHPGMNSMTSILDTPYSELHS